MSKTIGIFDSGVGGLTVVKALRETQPFQNLIYFGDTARVPYGSKSLNTIRRFSYENTKFLAEKGADAIVIACNSASAAATEQLKASFNLPIYGIIDAAVTAAIKKTKNGNIGIIGTKATIRTEAHKKKLLKFNPLLSIYQKACPLFVPLVEEGMKNKTIIAETIKEYLSFFLDKDIDTLILGCTHYPFLENEIKEFLGNKVIIIDPAKEIVKEITTNFNENTKQNEEYLFDFYVSDLPEEFVAASNCLMEININKVKQITIENTTPEELLKITVDLKKENEYRKIKTALG